MKGTSGQVLSASLRRKKPSNDWQMVIREHEVYFPALQRLQELIRSLNTSRLTNEMLRFQELLDEPRVTRTILQQQYAERRSHDSFFMLPMGGSFITAQNTPSSLTALTKS